MNYALVNLFITKVEGGHGCFVKQKRKEKKSEVAYPVDPLSWSSNFEVPWSNVSYSIFFDWQRSNHRGRKKVTAIRCADFVRAVM